MGRCRVKNRHLKDRDGWWHYRRRVPSDVAGSVESPTVDQALKTKDVIEARKRRDRITTDLERGWQKIRDAKARRQFPASVGGDEEAVAFAAFLHERDSGVDDDRDATTLGELYADEFDALAEKEAVGPSLGDLGEARGLVAATPEGKRLVRLGNAARGVVSITLAGESFLEQAALSLGTKRLYRGVYRRCSDHLPHPQQVGERQAREFIQRLARVSTASKVGNYRAALRALWDHLGLAKAMWSGFRIDAGKAAIRRDVWTEEETVQLLEGSSRKLRLAILIAAHTGAREGEIATMVYDAELDFISFPISKTEAGVRVIPCHDDIRLFVQEWVADPWSKFTIRNRFSELKIVLGFPASKVFHSFRHTLASRLHECEVQEATAAKIIGHKHPSLTFGWYGSKVGVETLRKPINAVRYPASVLAFGRVAEA